ncbi:MULTISPECIES: fibronectin type III domain-containing protein [unclassified Pseudoclavibacter]|uniref:fibronectin type III domain-containing protein n=1 Tax=unclassified Pseudoclavibacter TaxID=2615177 RepID=UPI001BADDB76|nr:fibronectin type III domain-containing protein [Pseudoclavibacter sp. Marseille-Q4354]MBS3179601.1 fibronectin type III domain-containing protein [Pseudoclavibacter sp. Marseille-Q4354]
MTLDAHETGARSRRLPAPGIGTRILAAIGIAGLLAGFGLLAADPAEAASTPISGVDLSWALNDEVGGGAYFGGCNFLSAGASGDNGRSAVWTDDSLYSASEGNVSITKPDAAGNQVPATWDSRCLDAGGSQVGTGVGSTSANRVNLADGSGSVDLETGTASISWEGAFTVVFYGGMTYWSVDDLTLELSNGRGTLTGTAGGFGADMDDPSKWQPLSERTVTLATIDATPAELTASGATLTPEYRGVDAGAVGTPQTREGDGWGSWPQDFVAFHEATGQSSYWYSSGGLADPKKVAAPLTLRFDTSASATPVYERLPRDYPEGAEVRFVNLGAEVSGEPMLRAADGRELPVLAGTRAQITAGGGVGTWDVSGLTVGAHEFTLAVRNGTAETPINLSPDDAIRLTIVEPLGATASPGITVSDVEASSFTTTLTWPATGGGPPTGYQVQLTQGGVAVGAALQVPADATGQGSTIVSGLAASTEYAITVTPYLATQAGTPATQQVSPGAPPQPTTTPDPEPPAPTTPPTTEPTTPTDGGASAAGATFYWGLNTEATSGAFFGGCNFLAAGKAGDTGSSRVWKADEYRSADGNVTIIKPNGSDFQQASWGTKCVDRTGANVSTSRLGSHTESQVRITGGEATHSGSELTVQWRGSFTVAFYGGLTYWTATDPILKVGGDGRGTITATASGYGASMTDASKWVELSDRTITLANLTGVDTGADVITTTPDYLGVSYSGSGQSQGVVGGDEGTASGQAPQTALNSSYWGSFPSDFVDFQKETGQFSYWFTSNGARDTYKPTIPLTVSLAGDYTPTAGAYNAPAAPTLTQSNPAGGTRAPNAVAPAPAPAPATTAPAAGSTTSSGGAAPSGAGPVAVSNEASGLQIGEISAPMVLGGGAGILAIAGLNWSISLLVRRRLGLDPHLFG